MNKSAKTLVGEKTVKQIESQAFNDAFSQFMQICDERHPYQGGMKKRKYEKPDELYQEIKDFFDTVYQLKITPTQEMFCMFADVSRMWVRNVREGSAGEEHASIVEQYLDTRLKANATGQLLSSSTNPAGMIANMNNNYGWSQNPQNVVNMNINAPALSNTPDVTGYLNGFPVVDADYKELEDDGVTP